MKASQNSRILKHLMKGYKLTPIGALSLFGVFRLASRICDIKKEGFPITTTMVTRNKKTYAEYSLNHQQSIGI